MSKFANPSSSWVLIVKITNFTCGKWYVQLNQLREGFVGLTAGVVHRAGGRKQSWNLAGPQTWQQSPQICTPPLGSPAHLASPSDLSLYVPLTLSLAVPYSTCVLSVFLCLILHFCSWPLFAFQPFSVYPPCHPILSAFPAPGSE